MVGDIHGQYYDLLRIFDWRGFPPQNNYLFLGNYVDHGRQSIETICLLLAYKIKYSVNFFLLRGNHESVSVNIYEGFYEECKRRYDADLWTAFSDVFNCLPFAAIIEEKIFCCHGGLSPDLHSMEQIRRIKRPTEVSETLSPSTLDLSVFANPLINIRYLKSVFSMTCCGVIQIGTLLGGLKMMKV